MNIVKKGILATTLAATALVPMTPALARDYYRDRGDNTAAVAIGAGVVGLALGAIIASSGKRDRYDDRRHVRDGYYYDRQGRRYARDDWQRRDDRAWRGSRQNRDWSNGRGWRDGRYDDRYDYGRDRDYYQRRGY